MQHSTEEGWRVMDQSKASKSGRWTARAGVWVAIIGMLTPVCGLGAGAGVFNTVSRSKMNDIVRKIAMLPEPYRDVWVRGLDFNPDGAQVATSSAVGSLEVWNWREERVMKTLTVPRGFNWGSAVNPIQYSPDGGLLSVCDGKGAGHVVIRVWSTKDWSVAHDVVDTGPGGCQSASFTPSGRFLLYVIDRVRTDELIAYATDTWSLAWRIQLDTSPEAIAISPDGNFVAVAGMTTIVQRKGAGTSPASLRYEQSIDLVDVNTGTLMRTLHGDAEGSVAWTPDSARVAVAGQGFVEIFDVHSGERVTQERTQNPSHMNIRFTPDGRYLIESDSNGRGSGLGVSIWDNRRSKLLQRISGNSPAMAVSKDGRYLAVGGDGHTTIWQFQ